MPLPSSGELRLRADIANEVDGSATGDNVSLGTLADSVGFSEPDAMSDFYSYSSCSYGTVVQSNPGTTTINSIPMYATITNGGCGPGGVNDACTNTTCQLDYGFRVYSTGWSLLHTFTVATGQIVSYGDSYSYTWTGASSGTTYYIYAWTRKTGDSTIYQTNMKSATTQTPITYNFNPQDEVRAQFENGNVNIQSYNSSYLYGQYYHSQLGWQTGNSCTGNGSFSRSYSSNVGVSGCQSWDIKQANFPRAYTTNSNSEQNARVTGAFIGWSGSSSCCADNYFNAYGSTNYTYCCGSYSSATASHTFYWAGVPDGQNTSSWTGAHSPGVPGSSGQNQSFTRYMNWNIVK